jgi:hypothetical protein
MHGRQGDNIILIHSPSKEGEPKNSNVLSVIIPGTSLRA